MPGLSQPEPVLYNAYGNQGRGPAETQVFNIGDFTTQYRPANAGGSGRARYLHHRGPGGSAEYSVRPQIRRGVDGFQQLVALFNRVASGKLNACVHAKPVCGFLRSGSVLPLIAAFLLSQANQEL